MVTDILPDETGTNEGQIKENKFLYWFLNILGASIPWVIIILLWIKKPIILFDEVNLWLIAFCIWPVVAFKISAKTLKAHETGGAYGLSMLGGEIPLLNNLAPEELYFAFPGFVSLSLDSLANRTYEIKGISDAELKSELERSGTDFTDKNVEALLVSWSRKGIYRFREITTATPTLSDPHWPSFPYPKVVDTDGTIREMNDYEKKAVRDRIKADINNKQITLSPSMQIILMIKDYFHYKKNVEGDTPAERRIETGVQLTNIARSMGNTELKKYTYSGLIYLQTSPMLDQRLEKEIEELLKGYGEGPKASMGLQVIDARITSLGAPKEVHTAVNAVVAEGFNVKKKELEGEGNKLKGMEEAKAESFREAQLGIGKARTLEMLFEKAKKYNVDASLIAKLQTELAAFEFGKHTYFFSDGGNSADQQSQAYAKAAAILADAINEALTKKTGKK